MAKRRLVWVLDGTCSNQICSAGSRRVGLPAKYVTRSSPRRRQRRRDGAGGPGPDASPQTGRPTHRSARGGPGRTAGTPRGPRVPGRPAWPGRLARRSPGRTAPDRPRRTAPGPATRRPRAVPGCGAGGDLPAGRHAGHRAPPRASPAAETARAGAIRIMRRCKRASRATPRTRQPAGRSGGVALYPKLMPLFSPVCNIVGSARRTARTAPPPRAARAPALRPGGVPRLVKTCRGTLRVGCATVPRASAPSVPWFTHAASGGRGG